tara:strand:+ start:179 stop:373 length:195 start_codon:yes stop_codon:yes gene_type:complete
MDIYRETEIKIEFANGEEFTPTIVKDGEEVASDYVTIFSNKTHQIEELLNYINECETDGCDVYL